jgi:hypothetical protein
MKKDEIIECYEKHQDWSNREIAYFTGTSKRHVRRILNPLRNKDKVRSPKILLLDIETAFMIVSTWGLYKQQIPTDNIIEDWFCLSWAAKWLFDDEIMSDTVTAEEALDRNDSRIILSVWKLIDEADILVGHNLNRFDLRRLNARFLFNGMNPPMPYRTIDTLKISQKLFGFSSYKLDYLTKLLGLTGKLHTNYQLWKDCIAGDEKALKQMNTYNKQDVFALEDLFVILRPWMKSQCNLGLYFDTEDSVCPSCGSSDLEFKGYYYTLMNRFKSGRCNSCGSIFRSRISDVNKEERSRLLIPTAR